MSDEAVKYGILAFQFEEKTFAYRGDDLDASVVSERARSSLDLIADMARRQATRLDG